jgi:peptidoglycan LD-endopeptidase CwlK
MKTGNKILIIGGVALLGLSTIAYVKRDELKRIIVHAVWDAESDIKIKDLHPNIRAKAREFLNKAEKQGLKLRIVSGLRDFQEQAELYKMGRTKKIDPITGKKIDIVTNAKAGQSMHNYGLAIDVVSIVNGKEDWENTDWKKVAQIGKSVGFEWGGNWKTFIDRPHFQMTFGNSLAQLQGKYKNKPGYYVNV